MSSTDGNGDDSGPGTREVAHRLFAAEFDDASLEYSESDEERAPNYVVTPTGLRVNRLFTVGVLTEVESVNEETVRGRVVDTTGAFVTYAGQYQPEELAFLERTTPPAFVALTGKARTFEPDDSDLVYTSVRPESVSEVDADTRDRWTVSTAEATLDRLAVLAVALELDERGDALEARLDAAGAPEPLSAGIPRALEHYGTTPAYVEAVRRLAVDTLEVVADEREEVRALATDPDATDPAEVGPLPDHGLDLSVVPERTGEADAPQAEPAAGESAATESAETTDSEPEPTASEASAAAVSGDTEAGSSTGSAAAEPEAEESAEPAEAAATAGAADSDTSSAVTDTGTDTDSSADTEAEAETGPGTEPEATTVAASESDGETPDASEDSSGESAPDAGTDEEAALGDFEDEDLGDFEDAVSDEERREVEEEHDIEFSSGSEVSDPGEADIETPEAATEEVSADESGETPDEPATDDGVESSASEGEAGDEGEASDGDGAAGASEDVDVEDAVVDLMDELDDGDGANREEVVAAAAERYGVSEDDADDAVQDALMSGKCYEPSEGTLKSI